MTSHVQPEDIERQAAPLRLISSFADLHAALTDIAAGLGFPYASLIHHAGDPAPAHVVNFSNLPEGLREIVISQLHGRKSPLRALCRNRAAGLTRAEALARPETALPGMMRTWTFIEGAYRSFGVGDSFIVPVTLADDVSGALQFDVRLGENLPTRMFPFAQYFGALVFEAARRIAHASAQPASTPSDLTARQIECIALAARGKSDWEIGAALNISRETVHKHIQAAMRRQRVTTRTQLVVRALHGAHISFGDVLG
jgi:LuxR family transcriptional regulator, quorum-sensing system regulator CciR